MIQHPNAASLKLPAENQLNRLFAIRINLLNPRPVNLTRYLLSDIAYG